MKRAFFIIIIAALSLTTTAQENQKKQDNQVKINELGLTFSSLDRFGLTYKTGRDQSIWRFQTFVASQAQQELSSNDYSTDQKNKNVNCTLKIGRAYISKITETIDFRFGIDFFYSYRKMKEEFNIPEERPAEQMSEVKSNEYGMNFVFGFHHLLNEHIQIGAEILPYFSYQSGSTKRYANGQSNNPEEVDLSGYSYGLSNNSVQVNLTYRF